MLSQSLSRTSANLSQSLPTLLRQWQIGQVLHARVESSSEAGELVLRIDGQKLRASTAQSAIPGDLLQVQVVDTDSRPVLKIIAHLKPETTRERVEYQLRRDLPKQKNLLMVTDELLQSISTSTSPRQAVLKQLPAALVRQIEDTTRQLPRLLELTSPVGVKKALLDSGLFMESKIFEAVPRTAVASTKTPFPNLGSDLKAGLLRLEDRVNKELTHKVIDSRVISQSRKHRNQATPGNATVQQQKTPIENGQNPDLIAIKAALSGAIAKIQVNQGQTIISHEQSSPQWIIDLPFIDGQRAGLVELLIGQKISEHSTPEDENNWSVELQLHLPSLGKVNVMLKLRQGHLNSRIWAEQEFSNTKIKKQLNRLEQGFEKAGFYSVSLQQHPFGPRQVNRDIKLPSLVETRI